MVSFGLRIKGRALLAGTCSPPLYNSAAASEQEASDFDFSANLRLVFSKETFRLGFVFATILLQLDKDELSFKMLLGKSNLSSFLGKEASFQTSVA